MMKYLFAAFLVLALGSFTYVEAAPTWTYNTSLLPQTTALFDLGSSSPAKVWRNLYVGNICLSGDCKTAWPTSGAAFPFTPAAWGNSTSTVIGFTQGIFANASSTFGGPFRLSALSDGMLAVYSGLVSSYATTTAGTGLTYSSNSFNVNTTQNIAKLSNLTGNGVVKTSGGDGTLGIGVDGTDFTLINAITCTSGDFVSAVTAAGVFTCTTPAASGGVTSIAVPQGTFNGALTFATSTSNGTGLTIGTSIVGSGSTLTFTPSLSGTLAVGNGGTGATTFSPNTLVGVNAAGTALIATGTPQVTLGWFNATSTAATSSIASNLTIGAANTNYFANAPLVITGSTNSYVQSVVQNLSNGNNASANFVFQNDLGTDTKYYGEVGINSSGYVQAAFSAQNPGDVYFNASDGGITISTASTTNTNADIRFLTGGTGSSSIAAIIKANNVNKNFGIGTTSPYAKLSIHAFNGNTNNTLFAIASSTSNATTTLFSVSNTGLITTALTGYSGVAVNAAGQLVTSATTTAGTGLSYNGTSFTVNTSQNIATLSNLTTNGVVITSGGVGTLSVDGSGLDVANGGTGAVTLTGVLLGNGTSAFTGASTQTCTNQFVRAMSNTYTATCATVGAADVSLANLSATNSTLTFSGTYNGSTARTIGLNLANSNTWSVVQQFNAGVGVPGLTSTSLIGIGTTTPKWNLTTASSTGPQLTLTDGSATSAPFNFRAIKSSFYISTSSPTTFATSTNPILTVINGGIAGLLGISTSSPWAQFSINSAPGVWSFVIGSSTATNFGVSDYGNIVTRAYQPATSTAIVLNWAQTGQQVEYQIGTSATTITLINATTSQYWGTTKRVWVCNPGSTAGALSWAGVEWIGTAPTQTTTANQCDIYSFNITRATSTPASPAYKVSGAASVGFQ